MSVCKLMDAHRHISLIHSIWRDFDLGWIMSGGLCPFTPTWRDVSSYLFTYLRLYPLNWKCTSLIMHKIDHTQVNLIQLKTFELELDFVEYIQHTDVRIADLCWPPTICRVTSYLRMLALSMSRANYRFAGSTDRAAPANDHVKVDIQWSCISLLR